MIREFGTLADGTVVEEITLRKGPLEAAVLTYGAIIRDLKFNGRSVVLGFDDLESYVAHSPYFGAVPGRCANRISKATVTIDGTKYQLGANENGNQLHGGKTGFTSRVWSLEQHDKGSVLLKYVSEDGEEGYPGRVEALVRYTLTGTGAVRVKLTATTDKPTIVNLTQHSYFNLDGSPTVLDHNVEIVADTYLPVDGAALPTGEIRQVAWTPYDFREGRKLRRKPGEEGVIFDHNFCLAEAPREEVEFAAAVEDRSGDCRLELWTTERACNFTTAIWSTFPCRALKAGPTAPMRACAWSRSAGPTVPTTTISRTSCCGRRNLYARIRVQIYVRGLTSVPV